MARNRTIKPTFWSDAKVCNLKRDARLLYIGLWNFADDLGVISADVRKIRNQIFPYDDLKPKDIQDWIRSLIEQGMVRKILYQGEEYLSIVNFGKHQVINRANTKAVNVPLDALQQAVEVPITKPTRRAERKPKQVPNVEVEDENYTRFNEWCNENAPEVMKMKYPISRDEFNKLKEEFGVDIMCKYLSAMSNWSPLLKKCTSANMTLRNWIRRDDASNKNQQPNANGVRPRNPSVSPDYAQSILARMGGSGGNDQVP